jgi:hypothetical protein
MTFKTTATGSAVLTLALASGYLFAGRLMVGRWQIEPTPGVLLLGRRLGACYLGLSLMFFLARSIPASEARRAICGAAVVASALLAILGIHDYLTGLAAAPILVSAALEVVVALVFARHLVVDRGVA